MKLSAEAEESSAGIVEASAAVAARMGCAEQEEGFWNLDDAATEGIAHSAVGIEVAGTPGTFGFAVEVCTAAAVDGRVRRPGEL